MWRNNMNSHDFVLSVINKTGLKFTDNGTNFSSIWKLNTNMKVSVIVAYDIHPEWVHILCKVGSLEEFDPSVPTILLRLNNSIIGSKFSVEQNYNIVCSSEILLTALTEEILKQKVTQIVKMMSVFYETVEKENLKLNST
jgi:hypothetical protein